LLSALALGGCSISIADLPLVGTPADIADAFMEYRDAGVSQFILSGWPKLAEMVRFGREVLPLVWSERWRILSIGQGSAIAKGAL